MSNRKKFAAAALSAVMAVAFVATPAGAQSVADLQAQIAALLAQITALQAQLNAQTGGGASAACSFTRDLTVGSTGNDVKCLQQYLNGAGYQVSASGAGSPGSETTTFGPATKAALTKWQSASGVSPASGYFGPISRAKYTSLAGGTGGTQTGGTQVPAPASGLAVSLAPDSPTGSVVAGAGQVNAMKFRLTAGTSGSATVTELKFTKVGVVSDTLINNLYLAGEDGSVIAQYSSLSNGIGTFSGLSLDISAGMTKAYTLRMDIAKAANPGNSIAWQLASGGVTAGSATVTGLPVSSNTLTVTTVTNPEIASAKFDFQSVGNTIDAGTSAALVSNATVNVQQSAVDLRSIKYTVVGSANVADLRNIKLSLNGTQIGSTVSAPNSSGAVVFDMSASPARMPTGNNTLQVSADIMGSPNRTMDWTVLRPYDVYLVDTQYNTGISPSFADTTSGSISINKGQITVQLASDTPTGNVAVGVSGVTLAKFTIYASGEAVKVKFLPVQLTASMGGSVNAISDDLRNIRITDDAGNQVGNTVSTPSGTWSTTSNATSTIDFGTSSSPINYVVPANTTRVLSLKVDIQSGSDLSSILGGLHSKTSDGTTVADNLEGQISFQTATSGPAQGSTLTVVSQPLSVAVNSAYTSPTLVAGQTGAKIGSYVFTASSAEGAKISAVSVTVPDAIDAKIQNLKLMVGSTQFGTTRATVNTGNSSDAVVQFSGSSPLTVAAGQSLTVDVYADIINGSTDSGTNWTSLATGSVTATGATSNSALTVGGLAATGQNVALASTRTLTVAQDSATSPSKFVVMSSSGNSLFKVRLTADNVEDVKITDITFRDTFTSTGGIASLSNLELYDSGTRVGGPLPLTVASGATTGTVTFSFSTPIVVTKSTSKTIELRGNIPTYEAGAVSGSVHNLGIPTTASVVALGKDSNGSVTVSGTPNSNTSTVARTKLTLASALLGSSSNRTRAAVDDIATMTFTADAGYQATVSTVTLKFSGLAVSNGTSFSASLIDADTNATWGSSAASGTVTGGAGNSKSVSFFPNYVLSAGASKSVKVRVDSSGFFDASTQGSQSLSVIVNSEGDLTWSDGTTSFNLEATVVPFTVVNVSYE